MLGLNPMNQVDFRFSAGMGSRFCKILKRQYGRIKNELKYGLDALYIAIY
jgi:hypothetical protein